jgi:hypothetical protein
MRWAAPFQDETANGTLEFAVVVQVLLLMFLGTVDYSRFMHADTAIRNAARVGLETAINPCSYQDDCLPDTATLSDSAVMWATYCEGSPYVRLQPSFTSCPPNAGGIRSAPCAAVCNDCAQDLCVSPAGVPSRGQTVTVTVGYSFQPLTFVIARLFPVRQCFPGDDPVVNHHTLCASSTGRVVP